MATSVLVRKAWPCARLLARTFGIVESLCSSRSASFGGIVSGYCDKMSSKSLPVMRSNAYWLPMAMRIFGLQYCSVDGGPARWKIGRREGKMKRDEDLLICYVEQWRSSNRGQPLRACHEHAPHPTRLQKAPRRSSSSTSYYTITLPSHAHPPQRMKSTIARAAVASQS